jgi:MFS family permease
MLAVSTELGPLAGAFKMVCPTVRDTVDRGNSAARTLCGPRDLLLTAVLVATTVSTITMPLAGFISDRIGRKRMYLIGSVATGVGTGLQP